MSGLSLMFYMGPYCILDSWRPEYAVSGGLIDVTRAKERWLHESSQTCLGGGFVPNDVTSCPDRRNGNDCSNVIERESSWLRMPLLRQIRKRCFHALNMEPSGS